MVNLDQIKLLESKVEKAVNLIKSLSEEKDSLKKEVEEKNKRISELENLIIILKDDQSKIEQGIVNALNHLSAFESSVYEKMQSESPVQAETNGQQPQDQVSQTSKLVSKAESIVNATDNLSGEKEQKEAESANLQRDLDDVLGENPDVSKQMDIF